MLSLSSSQVSSPEHRASSGQCRVEVEVEVEVGVEVGVDVGLEPRIRGDVGKNL